VTEEELREVIAEVVQQHISEVDDKTLAGFAARLDAINVGGANPATATAEPAEPAKELPTSRGKSKMSILKLFFNMAGAWQVVQALIALYKGASTTLVAGSLKVLSEVDPEMLAALKKLAAAASQAIGLTEEELRQLNENEQKTIIRIKNKAGN